MSATSRRGPNGQSTSLSSVQSPNRLCDFTSSKNNSSSKLNKFSLQESPSFKEERRLNNKRPSPTTSVSPWSSSSQPTLELPPISSLPDPDEPEWSGFSCCEEEEEEEEEEHIITKLDAKSNSYEKEYENRNGNDKTNPKSKPPPLPLKVEEEGKVNSPNTVENIVETEIDSSILDSCLFLDIPLGPSTPPFDFTTTCNNSDQNELEGAVTEETVNNEVFVADQSKRKSPDENKELASVFEFNKKRRKVETSITAPSVTLIDISVVNGKGEGDTILHQHQQQSKPTITTLMKKTSLKRCRSSDDEMDNEDTNFVNVVEEIKMDLYLETSKEYRGKGAEKIFSDYWEMLGWYFSHGKEEQEGGHCKLFLKSFLKTKHMARLHNDLILTIMKQSMQQDVSQHHFKLHIPRPWRNKVQQDAENDDPTKSPALTHAHYSYISQFQNDFGIHSGTWNSRGENDRDTSYIAPSIYSLPPFDISISSTSNTDTDTGTDFECRVPSASLPGALALDPHVRRMVHHSDMTISEDAIWFLIVAVREHAKTLLTKIVQSNICANNSHIITPIHLATTLTNNLKLGGGETCARIAWEQCVQSDNTRIHPMTNLHYKNLHTAIVKLIHNNSTKLRKIQIQTINNLNETSPSNLNTANKVTKNKPPLKQTKQLNISPTITQPPNITMTPPAPPPALPPTLPTQQDENGQAARIKPPPVPAAVTNGSKKKTHTKPNTNRNKVSNTDDHHGRGRGKGVKNLSRLMSRNTPDNSSISSNNASTDTTPHSNNTNSSAATNNEKPASTNTVVAPPPPAAATQGGGRGFGVKNLSALMNRRKPAEDK